MCTCGSKKTAWYAVDNFTRDLKIVQAGVAFGWHEFEEAIIGHRNSKVAENIWL